MHSEIWSIDCLTKSIIWKLWSICCFHRCISNTISHSLSLICISHYPHHRQIQRISWSQHRLRKHLKKIRKFRNLIQIMCQTRRNLMKFKMKAHSLLQHQPLLLIHLPRKRLLQSKNRRRQLFSQLKDYWNSDQCKRNLTKGTNLVKSNILVWEQYFLSCNVII